VKLKTGNAGMLGSYRERLSEVVTVRDAKIAGLPAHALLVMPRRPCAADSGAEICATIWTAARRRGWGLVIRLRRGDPCAPPLEPPTAGEGLSKTKPG